MGTVKLSKPQEALLKRIRRCPKGCFIDPIERRSALKLRELGLIDLNVSYSVAWPVEGK